MNLDRSKLPDDLLVCVSLPSHVPTFPEYALNPRINPTILGLVFKGASMNERLSSESRDRAGHAGRVDGTTFHPPPMRLDTFPLILWFAIAIRTPCFKNIETPRCQERGDNKEVKKVLIADENGLSINTHSALWPTHRSWEETVPDFPTYNPVMPVQEAERTSTSW